MPVLKYGDVVPSTKIIEEEDSNAADSSDSSDAEKENKSRKKPTPSIKKEVSE